MGKDQSILISSYLLSLFAIRITRLICRIYLTKVVENGWRTTEIMLVLAIFLILPSLVCAKNCSVYRNKIESENARIKCTPELMNGRMAKPSTVCVITCKENNLRFRVWLKWTNLDKPGQTRTNHQKPRHTSLKSILEYPMVPLVHFWYHFLFYKDFKFNKIQLFNSVSLLTLFRQWGNVVSS